MSLPLCQCVQSHNSTAKRSRSLRAAVFLHIAGDQPWGYEELPGKLFPNVFRQQQLVDLFFGPSVLCHSIKIPDL